MFPVLGGIMLQSVKENIEWKSEKYSFTQVKPLLFNVAEFIIILDTKYGIIMPDVMLVVAERSTEPVF